MIVFQSPAIAENARHRPCNSPSPGGEGRGEGELTRGSGRASERSKRLLLCCSNLPALIKVGRVSLPRRSLAKAGPLTAVILRARISFCQNLHTPASRHAWPTVQNPVFTKQPIFPPVFQSLSKRFKAFQSYSKVLEKKFFLIALACPIQLVSVASVCFCSKICVNSRNSRKRLSRNSCPFKKI
jgi:hypothetical protein